MRELLHVVPALYNKAHYCIEQPWLLVNTNAEPRVWKYEAFHQKLNMFRSEFKLIRLMIFLPAAVINLTYTPWSRGIQLTIVKIQF